MSCCETLSCHAHRHNDFEGHSNFSSTIYSFTCLEHITTVEINSGVLAFPVPLFTSGGLGLVILVLVLVLQAAVLVLVVLRIWSCLHH